MLFLLLLAGAMACRGPRPHVDEQQTMAPARPGAPYTVVARLRNGGAGEGQVEVDVQLVAADGTTYRGSRKVDLAPHEQTVLTLHIDAPPGDYVTRVSTRYPPR
ncbi:MAG TPA: hypothetical protein VFK20_06335 [Vicinamibacterales bacterium]|nr:hypothetical protein [Vicinamibacterales bacterium]